MLVNDTPVGRYEVRGVPILVKREDLCAPFPGPSFSKMRGVVAHIRSRPEPVIGVLDTLHSKAGWCVSYVCSQLGKKCVNFWPKYNADEHAERQHRPTAGDSLVYLPRFQQQQARELGATMVALKAGRSAILYHGAKKWLKEHYGADGYLMPNALKLPESITENAAEAERTAGAVLAGTSSPVLPDEEGTALVISISSGTVASGVLRGLESMSLLERYRVVLHLGYSRSLAAAQEYIAAQSGLPLERVKGFEFVDEGYGYADAVPLGDPPPFPCNPYYDAKAWRWLTKPSNLERFADHPILFWNIGA